jgi:type III secretory pathway lipoprotein EscJ
MKNLVNPENEAEAYALQSLLAENGIEAAVVSFHDTAYDGLFQAQYGWGVIRVAAKDFARAREIIREWRESSPDSFDWQEE